MKAIMNYTLNNLIQKKKSSLLFAVVFCLSFSLTAQKYKDFDKDHHIGLHHWEIPSKDPDRIILNFNGDPSTKRAVTWRTDLSVKNAKAQIAVAGVNSKFAKTAKTYKARQKNLI